MVKPNPRCRLSRLVVAGVILAGLSAASATGPFVGLAGSWKGDGVILLGDGSQETILCRAAYVTDATADALDVDLSCASDSFKVHIVSHMMARDNGQFSGSWQETTKQAEGSVSGVVPAPGQLQASFEAMGVGIQLAARTSAGTQAITIHAQGTEIKGANLRLRRS